MKQLDLLSWRPAPVSIIPFPTKNRVGLIRRTASNIVNSRTDREAQSFWRRSVDGLEKQMRKAGVAEDRVEAELAAFQRSVEMRMAAISRRPSRPGDGAA